MGKFTEEDLQTQLEVDPVKVSSKIAEFIAEKLHDAGKEGIALGLSGGVDSATLATLAAKAVGPNHVHGLYLPDRTSEGKYSSNAQVIASDLGIIFNSRDITEKVSEQGPYQPLITKIVSFSSYINRLNIYLSRIISRTFLATEPYILALEGGSNLAEPMKTLYRGTVKAIEDSFNLKQKIRRKILLNYAEERNLLPIGATNRSERLIGWFVKDGIDDLKMEPLMGLLKSQVRELAKFLGLPSQITTERPSPDMFKGAGDERLIGIPYEKIDKALLAIENDCKVEELPNQWITPDEFKKVKKMIELSESKRSNVHIYPSLE